MGGSIACSVAMRLRFCNYEILNELAMFLIYIVPAPLPPYMLTMVLMIIGMEEFPLTIGGTLT